MINSVFDENADGGNLTFRWGNLTWGTLNPKWEKMRDHQLLHTKNASKVINPNNPSRDSSFFTK